MDKIGGDGGGRGGRWVQPGWGEGRGEKAYNCNWITIKKNKNKEKIKLCAILGKMKDTYPITKVWKKSNISEDFSILDLNILEKIKYTWKIHLKKIEWKANIEN